MNKHADEKIKETVRNIQNILEEINKKIGPDTNEEDVDTDADNDVTTTRTVSDYENDINNLTKTNTDNEQRIQDIQDNRERLESENSRYQNEIDSLKSSIVSEDQMPIGMGAAGQREDIRAKNEQTKNQIAELEEKISKNKETIDALFKYMDGEISYEEYEEIRRRWNYDISY